MTWCEGLALPLGRHLDFAFLLLPPTCNGAAESGPVILCPCLQRWRTLGPEKVALFAACNLPWLDFKFELAPKAGLNTGAARVVQYI